MKSLLERAKARPLHSFGIVIAVIALLILLWWLFCPNAKKSTAQPKPSMITNQRLIIPKMQSEASAPASTVANTDKANAASASAPTVTTTSTTTAPTTPVNAALPKDPTTAAEELDRLKDEQNRLKERKKELAKQLAISNKLIALKDQQLKDLGQTNP